MSTTKIVIIVLILVAVIFVIFVARGALRNEPEKDPDQEATEFTEKPPGWTKAIKGFIGSRQPKIDLKRSSYTSEAREVIPPDEQNPFRTAKFKLRTGVALIRYEDKTKNIPKDMEKLKDQNFRLPDSKNDDPEAGNIVALKGGGVFTFRCDGTAPCRVDVEK